LDRQADFWPRLPCAWRASAIRFAAPIEDEAMHPQGEILLKAMAVACVTFFVVKIGAAGLPVLMAALAAN
jgi:hypothetical protein